MDAVSTHSQASDPTFTANKNNNDDEKSTNKKRVLYIFPLARDYAAVKSLPKSITDRYEFHFIDSEHFSYSSKASAEFSMIQFIDKCIEKVKNLRIDIVISTRDMADLVHAVLASKFDHIKGPHYLSSFITLYKPYTKTFIDTDNAINYEIINVTQPKWQNIAKDPDSKASVGTISALLTKLNGKGFMKPPAASCSSLVGDFADKQTFHKLLDMHSKNGQIFNHYLPAFVDKYVSDKKCSDVISAEIRKKLFDSQAISNILLVEEFMNTPIKVTVDGLVVNKEIFVWGIVDSVYWTNIGKNECFVGCFMPSNLSRSVCNELVKVYKIYMNRLINLFAFDNQFCYIECFVVPKTESDLKKCSEDVLNWKVLEKDDVDIRLMEVNARCFMQMTPIYRQLFEGFGGDPIASLLRIYDGNEKGEFEAPKLLKGISGLNGYLPTFTSGKAEELFDFDAAEKYIESGEVILAVQRGEMVNTVSQQGSLLAYANVIGKDYKECFDKMIKIGKELVKKGAPWRL